MGTSVGLQPRKQHWYVQGPLPAHLFTVLVAAILALSGPAHAAPVLGKLSSEVAELHASTEESWDRINNITEEMRKAGVLPSGGGLGLGGGLPPASGRGLGLGGGLPPASGVQIGAGQGTPQAGVQIGAGLGTPQAGTGIGLVPQTPKVPRELLEKIQKQQSEFAGMQQQAFKIGRESEDNDELARHPDLNNYLQSLREFQPKLKALMGELEGAYKVATGKRLEKPKKPKTKQTKTIKGLSETDIERRAREEVARGANSGREFRNRAMDLISSFRERQLQMQDQQQDLQRAMEGPDWPKEDWPLSTQDAKFVGDAEAMIQGALAQLTKQIEPFGGLGRAHESNDESVLEKIAALNEMMAGYGELIDRHVATVKKVYKSKQKAKGKPAARATAQGVPQDGSLRDRLMNFGGSQADADRKPFAWLNDQGGQASGLQSSGLGSSRGDGIGSVGVGSLGGLPSAGMGTTSSLGGGYAPGGMGTASSLGGGGFGTSAGMGTASSLGGGGFGTSAGMGTASSLDGGGFGTSAGMGAASYAGSGHGSPSGMGTASYAGGGLGSPTGLPGMGTASYAGGGYRSSTGLPGMGTASYAGGGYGSPAGTASWAGAANSLGAGPVFGGLGSSAGGSSSAAGFGGTRPAAGSFGGISFSGPSTGSGSLGGSLGGLGAAPTGGHGASLGGITGLSGSTGFADRLGGSIGGFAGHGRPAGVTHNGFGAQPTYGVYGGSASPLGTPGHFGALGGAPGNLGGFATGRVPPHAQQQQWSAAMPSRPDL